MNKVEFVAEVGKNFIDSTNPYQTVEEALLQAKRLAHKAKEAGATVVKFQCHVLEDEKDKRNGSRWNWIQRNEELTPDIFWYQLKLYCDWLGVEMLVTGMSKLAAEKINPFVRRHKIGSADITDMELLEYLKSTGKPIILSTGMSTEDQIDKAVEFLGDQIQCLMYCISIYPCPVYKINLTRLIQLSSKYEIPVGFSDHSLSTEVPALAVRMGARIIEKHFTLDRNAYGPDHKASLLPDEFKKMVELCKLAETEGESFEQEKEFWKTFRI